MEKVARLVKIVCCALIIGLGTIYFVHNDATANIPDDCDVTPGELADNFGDGTAYMGNVDVHVGGCWLSQPINCMVCGD